MRAANTYLAFAQKQRSEGVSAERWVSVVPALSLHWSLAAPSDSAAVSGQLFAWRRHLPSKWRLRFAWLCAYRNELETACSLVETSLSSERWDKTTLNQFAKASGDPKRYGDLFRASLGRIDTLERIQERLKQGERKSAFVLLTRLAEIRKPKQGWLKPKEGR